MLLIGFMLSEVAVPQRILILQRVIVSLNVCEDQD